MLFRANRIHRCDACCPAVPHLSLPRGYKWRAHFWNLRAPARGVVVEILAFGARGSEIDHRHRQSLIFLLIFPSFLHRNFKDNTTPGGLRLIQRCQSSGTFLISGNFAQKVVYDSIGRIKFSGYFTVFRILFLTYFFFFFLDTAQRSWWNQPSRCGCAMLFLA